MSMTPQQAADTILTLFKTAWDTTGYQVHYEDVKKDRDETSLPWATTQVRHVESGQSTLSGDIGQRRFTRVGRFTVQIFVPSGKGLQEGYRLAKIISDALEGVSSSSLWFRNVVTREIGRDGAFSQLNVIAEFTYDEVR